MTAEEIKKIEIRVIHLTGHVKHLYKQREKHYNNNTKRAKESFEIADKIRAELNETQKEILRLETKIYQNEHTRDGVFKVMQFVDGFIKSKSDKIDPPKEKRLCLQGEHLYYKVYYGWNKPCYKLKVALEALSTLYGFLREVKDHSLYIHINPKKISDPNVDIKTEFESFLASTKSIEKFKL